jgi:hypothetical protein
MCRTYNTSRDNVKANLAGELHKSRHMRIPNRIGDKTSQISRISCLKFEAEVGTVPTVYRHHQTKGLLRTVLKN